MAARLGWASIVSMLLLGVLLQFHVRQIVASSVLYDDAFIATAAKNLAMGAGYSSSYHGIDRFDPEISTGPVIVLPTALLIRLLGNEYWVPGLAITLLIWATLLLLIVRMRPLGGAWHSLGLAVMAGGLFVFDMMRLGQPGFVSQNERWELCAAFGLPTARPFGRFTAADWRTVLGVVEQLDAQGREGAVFKEEGPGGHRTKFVTAWSGIYDIAVRAEDTVELPGDFFTGRILRLALYLDEAERVPDDPLLRDLGRAFLEGLGRSVARFKRDGHVFHDFRCRFRHRENAIAWDKDEQPVFLAESVWKLQYAMKHHPKVRFHFTSDLDREESRVAPKSLAAALSMSA